MKKLRSLFTPEAAVAVILLLLAVAFGGIFCLRYRIFQECVAPWLGLAALLYGILYLLFRPRK